MKPVIVIPTYNERENITRLIPALFDLNIPNLTVIIVDDNSPDETALIAQNFQEKYPVHVIKRQRKLGLGTAYLAGFKKALALKADAVLEMDADFSHDPADVPRLLAGLTTADMTIGSRRTHGGKIIGWGLYRHLTSWIAMFVSRLLLNFKTKDVTAGFRAYRRQVLETVLQRPILSNGYAFQEEILYIVEKNGFLITEIPVIFTDRTVGKSKLSRADIWEFFKVMKRLRREKLD